MKNTFIPPVTVDKDKGDTYRKLMDRYDEAIQAEFYLEAVTLLYAMMEDRFSEMLRLLGLAEYDYKKRRFAPLAEYSEDLYRLLNPKKLDERRPLGPLVSISGKSQIIRALSKDGALCPEALLVHRECVLAADESRKTRRNGERGRSIQQLIRDVEKWGKLRHQYVHSLFHKNYDAAMNALPDCCSVGHELAKELGNYCGRLRTQARNRGVRKTY